MRDDGTISTVVRAQIERVLAKETAGSYEELLKLIFPSGIPELGRRAYEHATYVDKLRLRVSYARILGGRELCLRPFRPQILSPEEAGIPERVTSCFRRLLQGGLMLVAGQMGSGKSTTVAALSHHLARQVSKRWGTLEDPVEIILPSAENGSTFSQRSVGEECESFAQGLKEARRQHFHAIVVGEIRDAETAEQCLRGALMGNLMVATIHGGDASDSLRSFIAEMPKEKWTWAYNALASSLKILMVQRLLYHPETGKVVPLHEVLLNFPEHTAVAIHIRTGDFDSIPNDIANGRPEGMQSFRDSLRKRVDAGDLPKSMLREASLI